MEDIQKVVLIIHTIISLGIIALVLLQRGKGADAGAAFGAGASGTVFGSRGSGSFFSRATAVLATAFFATSLTLAYLSSQRSAGPESLLEGIPASEAEEQVVAPVEADETAADMPSLEAADTAAEGAVDKSEMPLLEQGNPAEDEDQ